MVDVNYTGTIDSDHPFESLEDFFLKGGFQEFRTEFFTEEIKHGPDRSAYYRPKGNMSIDDEHMLYEDDLTNTLYQEPQKIYFKNELRNKLDYKRKSSCELVVEKIDTLHNDGEVVTYIKKLLIQLNNLALAIKSNGELSKHKSPLIVIYQIINWLHTTYNLFFSEIKTAIIQEAIDNIENIYTNASTQAPGVKQAIIGQEHVNQNIQKKDRLSERGLSWAGDSVKNTFLLHFILSENGIIPKDTKTLENFRIAFSGELIETPLKIRWLLTRGKNKNIRPPLKLIIKDVLMDQLKALEKLDNGPLVKKLQMIFVDSNGNDIPNMGQLPQAKNNKISPLEHKVVSEIRSAGFTVIST